MKTRQFTRTTAIVLFAILIILPAFQSYGRSHAAAIRNSGDLALGPARAAESAMAPEESPQKADFLVSDPSGWIDMTPKSFRHWTRMPVPPGKPLDPDSQWKLDKQHGTVICEGNHGHEWLRYNHEYANILLHVEWRFAPKAGATGYNSGVFVRNDRTGRVWHQAQVGTRAYIFGQTLVEGNLSRMTQTPAPAVDPLRPVGEWNTYEIRCDGPKITLWVNGDLTGEFATPEVPKGYWGLEAEGYWIEFRNIKLKVLK